MRKSRYLVVNMRNGLRALRLKANWTIEEAATAFGYSRGGYEKKERSERGLSGDFIKKACEVFGVTPEEVMGAPGVSLVDEIDPVNLEELVVRARQRLGSLEADEAKEMIRALISASRKPRGAGPNQNN